MQRATVGMRGFPRGGGRGSIKSRLGVSPGGGIGRRNVGIVQRTAGIQRRLGGMGGGTVAISPLSARAVGIKARLGGRGGTGAGVRGRRSVAALAIGEVLLDARQKINLSRVQTGRIGDARQKIEEKRRKNSIGDGRIRNLRIITPTVDHYNNGRGNAMSGGMSMRPQPQQGLISRSERESMGYEGGFRSAAQDTYAYNVMREAPMMAPPHRITRSGVGGGSYPPGMRIAPSQDDFVLTRTIRNPAASSVYGGGGGGGMRSDYIGRSPPQGVARVAPSIQYASHSSYNRSSLREQPMDMDDEMYDAPPPPPRRSEYSVDSQCRILVSNLQPSVTADDIVELFSDIGPLTDCRMTASGQAEVSYSRKSDALKAIEAYHNRLLDGSAMRVFLDASPPSRPSMSNSGSYTALKSASGASIKLPAGKKDFIKIQPDIGAIHKVLFNPGSSATRGLFKGGQ